jgi:hypothetical protein
MTGKSIEDQTLWNVPKVNGKPEYDPMTGDKNPYLQDHYEPKASEILKKEYPHIYAGYMAIVEEQFELFSKKHLDYGMANISAGTLLATEEERAFALTGLWYRISDKISRWKNLLINNKMINNEPLTDTYQDIVNYGIIAQLVERGLWKK